MTTVWRDNAPSGGLRRRHGFTLIELVTVIVILGILSIVAVPAYLDYTIDARKSACKGALGGMRSAIANFRAWSQTDAGGASVRFPSLTELTTLNTVLQSAPPPNPFDTDGTPNNVVDGTGQSKGTLVGSTGGWCYNPATGEIWANTGTKTTLENSF